MAKKKNSSPPKKENAKKESAQKKMTIYEYEQKYVKRQNSKGARALIGIGAAVIGLFLFVLLAMFTLDVYDKNEYAGYAAGAVCLLLYLFVFVLPLVKIFSLPYFVTNVNAMTAKRAQRHNRRVRRALADKIIHFTSNVDGAGWYDSETVGKMAIALRTGDEEKLKGALTELYKGSVKKTAKGMILKASMRSALYSALSQDAKIDAALIVLVNVQLVKDIVFLYGFRPSDVKFVKIVATVLQNSLIALGLGGMNIGNTVAKTMGEAVRGIPILGTAISAIVDSSVQGLVNGTLTAIIGHQTIKYLSEEYHLQDILDGIDVSETEEELQETCVEIETRLKKKKIA